VHLRTEVVESTHSISARQELVGEMRTDEAGATRDENVSDA
jgi:hypothetical protein